jgi:hypothetical protein
MTDLNRLGKRGSYRLGQLRTQGMAPPGPPPPLRPRFRRAQQGPAAPWLLAGVAGAALIAAGAVAGLWYAPFAVGVAAGLASRIRGWRPRLLVPVVAAAGIAGWAIPLWWPALHGQPAGGRAPVIANLAGLPNSVAVGVLVTLLVAALQGLAGLLVGCALALSGPAIPAVEAAGAPDSEAEGGDVAVLGPAFLGTRVSPVAVPGAGVAGAGVPGVGVPEAGIPGAGVPGAGVPGAGVAGAGVPDVGFPVPMFPVPMFRASRPAGVVAQVMGAEGPNADIPDAADENAGGGSGAQPGAAAGPWGDD